MNEGTLGVRNHTIYAKKKVESGLCNRGRMDGRSHTRGCGHRERRSVSLSSLSWSTDPPPPAHPSPFVTKPPTKVSFCRVTPPAGTRTIIMRTFADFTGYSVAPSRPRRGKKKGSRAASVPLSPEAFTEQQLVLAQEAAPLTSPIKSTRPTLPSSASLDRLFHEAECALYEATHALTPAPPSALPPPPPPPPPRNPRTSSLASPPA